MRVHEDEREENEVRRGGASKKPSWVYYVEVLPGDPDDEETEEMWEVPALIFKHEPTLEDIAQALVKRGFRVSSINLTADLDDEDRWMFKGESDDDVFFFNIDPDERNPAAREKNPRAKMPRLFDPKPIRYDVFGAGPDTAGEEYGKIWAPPPPLGAAWDSDEWGDYEVALLRAMREAEIPARPAHKNDPASGTAHIPPKIAGNDFIIWQHDGEDEFHLFFDPGDLK